MIREVIEKYLFPPALYCIACGAIIDNTREYMLCDDCMKELKWNTGATCRTCGKPLGPAISSALTAGLFNDSRDAELLRKEGNTTSMSSRVPNIARYCHNCMQSHHYFDRGYSCLSYGGREKTPILALKHAEKGYIARALGEMLADRLLAAVASDGELPWDVLVPVPIHPSRRVARGYNQTELIADEVSRILGIPTDKTSLIRVRATEKMKGMTDEGRQKNIEGAFAISADAERSEFLRNKRVLLIDDVYTTGATADACSKALLSAGANSVEIATIATGANFRSEAIGY